MALSNHQATDPNTFREDVLGAKNGFYNWSISAECYLIFSEHNVHDNTRSSGFNSALSR
jgi:hypothetical protein